MLRCLPFPRHRRVEVEFDSHRFGKQLRADGFQIASQSFSQAIQDELIRGSNLERPANDPKTHPICEPEIKPLLADPFGQGGSQGRHDFPIVSGHFLTLPLRVPLFPEPSRLNAGRGTKPHPVERTPAKAARFLLWGSAG